MKDRIDLRGVATLIKRNFIERLNAGKKGKDRDFVGFGLRLVLIAAFIAVFVLFFERFIALYFGVLENGVVALEIRAKELLTLAYTAILAFLAINGITAINKELFTADDVKLLAAMPLGATTIFAAKIVVIYLTQLVASVFAVLPVVITLGAELNAGAWFYGMGVLSIFLLPAVAIAIAAFFALPFYFIQQFLRERSAAYFVVIVLLTAGGVALYAFLLTGIKELLLGSDFRYFFDEALMKKVAVAVKWLVPGRWFASLLGKTDLLESCLGLAGLSVGLFAFSLFLIRLMLTRMLQQRIQGAPHFHVKPRAVGKRSDSFIALMKKEFLMIFRTPSYAFSYFSVAIVMPLMVFFCMSVGASLVDRLVGVDVRFELAIFLTLLFGALTNMFCSTNISRDGAMFYSIKAMPLSWVKVFFSKVVLCLAVSAFSQCVSALLLAATGYIGWGNACFLFGVGLISAFAEIAVATRFDFNHAHFFTEEDGEARESGNTVSLIIVLSLLFSFLVGGAVLYLRLVDLLGGLARGYLTYVVAGTVSLAAAAGAAYYLVRKLSRKYYEFGGGGGV